MTIVKIYLLALSIGGLLSWVLHRRKSKQIAELKRLSTEQSLQINRLVSKTAFLKDF